MGFAEPNSFDDNPTTREVAMEDTTPENYDSLARKLRAHAE